MKYTKDEMKAIYNDKHTLTGLSETLEQFHDNLEFDLHYTWADNKETIAMVAEMKEKFAEIEQIFNTRRKLVNKKALECKEQLSE